MHKLLILGFAGVLVAGCMHANDRDTTLIKRPYYLGFSVSHSRFGGHAVDGTPFDMANIPRANQSYEELYYDQSIGVEFAFPFLRRWECESNFEFVQTFGWKQHCIYFEINNPPPQEIIWYAVSQGVAQRDLRLRSFFSYEVIRKGKFALNAGAGGWYSSIPRVGAEAGLKCYYAANRTFTFQLGFTAGYSAMTKLYGAARFSVLLTGIRTYRVQPQHYYVRTYED